MSDIKNKEKFKQILDSRSARLINSIDPICAVDALYNYGYANGGQDVIKEYSEELPKAK